MIVLVTLLVLRNDWVTHPELKLKLLLCIILIKRYLSVKQHTKGDNIVLINDLVKTEYTEDHKLPR